MTLTYATVCSGVEAVSLAWEPLGFTPVFFSEIEAFPNVVLTHHWPEVPNLGDMTAINGWAWARQVNILWGSTPCQAFSMAGRRQGVSDPRGALTLGFVNLADDIDPDVVCWENVEGVLNDDKNAFGCLLGALSGGDEALVPPGKRWTDAGYVSGPRRSIAWRLFNAKHGGVAQQRKRVFVIASAREGVDPHEILFERGAGAETRLPPGRFSSPDSAAVRAYAVAIRGRAGGEKAELGGEVSNCLRASQGGSDKAYVLVDNGVQPAVRLLTPLECERLMGMPDNHTLIPFGRGMASDSVRYKAIGNSIAVPDVRWIGERIASCYAGGVT